MQRSMTPSTPSPAFGGATAPASGFGARSGFMSGLMGGLIGAGIGGLLFGHGFFGGMMGFRRLPGLPAPDRSDRAGGAARWSAWFRRRQSPAFAGGPNIFARGGSSRTRPDGRFRRTGGPPADPDRPAGLPGIRAAAAERPGGVEPARSGRTAFDGDAGDVELLQRAACRPGQPWRAERGFRRAPAARRPGAGVARGQPRIRLGGDAVLDDRRDARCRPAASSTAACWSMSPATELWTFVRSSGGQWILSAIQQAR